MTQNVQRRCVPLNIYRAFAPLHFLKCVRYISHTRKPIRTTPEPRPSLPCSTSPTYSSRPKSSPSIDASSVTPQKCNADVLTRYPSPHCFSSSEKCVRLPRNQKSGPSSPRPSLPCSPPSDPTCSVASYRMDGVLH